MKVAPSILSADFRNLGEEVHSVQQAGADYIHIDVMDGLFVPNISFAFPIIEALRPMHECFLDVHLMIDRPQRYVERFCKAGADLVNVHLESDTAANIRQAISIIRRNGKKTGITLKPGTPAQAALPFLPLVDLVLVMTVEPGFGGQKFMEDQLPKISVLKQWMLKDNPACELEVDGGIDDRTALFCRDAGADVLVAGSYVFKSTDRAAAIANLKK